MLDWTLYYETRDIDTDQQGFKDFKVGDVVRGSVDSSKSVIVYEFPVLYIKPQEILVLGNCGTFQVSELYATETRLVIRTQGEKPANFWLSVVNDLFMLGHYIMERRTLQGIKIRAEAYTHKPSLSLPDVFWFLGIVLSAFGILHLVFVSKGIQAAVWPSVLTLLWLFTLLIFEPVPVYSIGCVVMVLIVTYFVRIK